MADDAVRVVEIPPLITSLGSIAEPGVALRSVVTLVGAGGVGARLAPLLIKHMIPGDVLRIIDDDLVEMKNVRRQHFTRFDVGRAKAEVVAERALAAAPADGIMVDARVTRFDRDSVWRQAEHGPPLPSRLVTGQPIMRNPTILITAVDNLETRRMVEEALQDNNHRHIPLAWIDCGNRNTTGQALIACLRLWAVELEAHVEVGRRVGVGARDPDTGERQGPYVRHALVEFHGWDALAPSYLSQQEDPEEEGCATRLDTQTVMANMWAATAAATLAVPLLEFKPIGTLGIAFSSEFGSTQMSGVAGISRAFNNRHTGTLTATRRLLA